MRVVPAVDMAEKRVAERGKQRVEYLSDARGSDAIAGKCAVD